MKRCSSCQIPKPIDQFPQCRVTRDGVYSYCKLCSAVKKRESNARVRERDPDAYRKRLKRYQDTYKVTHPEKVRHGERRRNLRKFGLSVQEYDTMFESQEGCCAICGVTTEKALAVDHNHETGAVRGLLCSNCNMALGQFEIDNRLMKALHYIERFM